MLILIFVSTVSAQTKDKYTTSNGYAYLTKRTLVMKAKSAGKKAAKAAMETMGYVITIEDGWVVRKNQDGTIEQLELI